MKKMLALSLSAAMLLGLALALGSCAGCFPMDTTGLLEAAPALIERSALLNEIYFGEGIPFDRSVTDYGAYYPAELDYLEEHGFGTVAELRALTAEVFSADYTELIAKTTLGGFAADGTTDYIYARYSSSQAENLRDENETILVHGESHYLTYPIGKSTYHYETVRLGAVGRSYAYVVLSVTTVTKEIPPAGEPAPETPTYTTATSDMEIRFIKEGDSWRIDGPTY